VVEPSFEKRKRKKVHVVIEVVLSFCVVYIGRGTSQRGASSLGQHLHLYVALGSPTLLLCVKFYFEY
jgi:hypothetical protein